MPVANLILELDIPHAQSLKDRRQVVRSVKDTLRRGFNVSAAELDETIAWNRATLGVAAISRSQSYLEGQLQQVEQAARRAAARYGAEILEAYMELATLNEADEPTPLFAMPPAPPFDPPASSPRPESAIVTTSDDSNA